MPLRPAAILAATLLALAACKDETADRPAPLTKTVSGYNASFPPTVWSDPDTGCEYLVYGVGMGNVGGMVPRYTLENGTNARTRVKGCR